jgi:hypothetical protein
MTLQVVGAGFGRTGTNSLKIALEDLGFSKCHHMKEVFGSLRQVDAWHRAAHGGEIDWEDVFAGYQASCDWPSSAYWERLYEHYPECKIILTTREPERWYQSTIETIFQVTTTVPGWLVAIAPPVRRMKEMVDATVWSGVFDGRFEDRDYALQLFREHEEKVKRVVAPERLLVFQAKDGWEPLCAFLGVPVPATPYPHVNDTASMKRMLRVLNAVRWLPLAVLVGLVLAFVL